MLTGYSTMVNWVMEYKDGHREGCIEICFANLRDKKVWKNLKKLTYICPDLVSTMEGGYVTTDKFLALARTSALYREDEGIVTITPDKEIKETTLGAPLAQNVHVSFSMKSIDFFHFLVLVSPLRLLQEVPMQVFDIVKISEKYPRLSFLECYFISMFCGTTVDKIEENCIEIIPGWGLHYDGIWRKTGHALMSAYGIEKIQVFNEEDYIKNISQIKTLEVYNPIHRHFFNCSQTLSRTPTSNLYDLDTTPLSVMYGDKDE